MIKKMAEVQKSVDDHIQKEKGINTDHIKLMLFSANTELGELNNSWRRFKTWSNDQEPREDRLEEYCDVLAFLLSAGNALEFTPELVIFPNDVKAEEADKHRIIEQTQLLWYMVSSFSIGRAFYSYEDILGEFFNLGIMHGFTLKDIETCYYKVVDKNHARQINGY